MQQSNGETGETTHESKREEDGPTQPDPTSLDPTHFTSLDPTRPDPTHSTSFSLLTSLSPLPSPPPRRPPHRPPHPPGLELAETAGIPETEFTCGDLVGFAAAATEGTDDCAETQLGQAVCCVGEVPDAADPCGFCADGLPNPDAAVPTTDFTCADLGRLAQKTEAGTGDCVQLGLAAILCCPGGGGGGGGGGGLGDLLGGAIGAAETVAETVAETLGGTDAGEAVAGLVEEATGGGAATTAATAAATTAAATTAAPAATTAAATTAPPADDSGCVSPPHPAVRAPPARRSSHALVLLVPRPVPSPPSLPPSLSLQGDGRALGRGGRRAGGAGGVLRVGGRPREGRAGARRRRSADPRRSSSRVVGAGSVRALAGRRGGRTPWSSCEGGARRCRDAMRALGVDGVPLPSFRVWADVGGSVTNLKAVCRGETRSRAKPMRFRCCT